MPAPRNGTQTIVTLDHEAWRKLDLLRGETPPAAFLDQLLKEEERRRDKEDFIRTANSAYTDAVSEETLRVNESYPISDE